MKKYIAFIFGVLIVVCGISMGANEKNDIKGLRVELMIFSGRQNPVFVINDPKLIDELTTSLKGLPKHPTFIGQTVAPSRLGYRGIRVENYSTSALDIQSFIIYRSNVELRHGKDVLAVKEFKLDGSTKLERRLLELARLQGAIDEKMSNYIENGR